MILQITVRKQNHLQQELFYILIIKSDIFTIKFYMLKARGKNYDNVSVAPTKSSKTLKSKINNNPQTQVKKFEPPYFKVDHIKLEMQNRAKNENQKHSLLQKFNINLDKKENPLDKVHNIYTDLINRHQQTKEKLKRLKEDAQNRNKLVCPFQPEKKKIDKIIVDGGYIRRNEIWLQERKRKQFLKKQDLIIEDLSNCTFSPSFLSKKQSQIYLKNRNREHDKTVFTLPRQRSLTLSPKKSTRKMKKDISFEDFEQAKRNISMKLWNT